MPSDVSKKRDHRQYLRSGVAGGFAACVAKTVVAPLDRVKILFQASNPDFQKYAGTWTGAYRAGKEIYGQTGIRGLFQGHSITLLRIFPYGGVKYMTYDSIHDTLMPTRESETNLRRFLAGSASGLISVSFTYPLDLIRVRMAFKTRRSSPELQASRTVSLANAVREIYREGAHSKPPSVPTVGQSRIFSRFPLLSFYRGFSVTMLGIIPYAGTNFLAWGYLRATFLPPKSEQKKPTPIADLVIGAISGASGQTVSYPLEVIRRRMQVGGLTQPDRWIGFGETVRRIWATSGWRGFYVGLSIGYLKIVPMTATSFAVWQWAKRLLDV
ncbi:mitochondrial carrier [Schizopora paradoxa]|uniref:Mitochondrial carrier n=1 Tax=Schizopora paradoxa TaxID=27342 RepID=A0A0H2RUG6_9AGAM|nr:mitochondrial carrier [Schizopora paradoxa]